MLHIFLRRVCAALALCIVLTVPAVLLTGCGGRSAESPVPTQQMPARSMEERKASLGPYMEATTAYNSTMLPLSLAVSTTVSDLRQGKHLTSIILPPLSKLRRELDAARASTPTSMRRQRNCAAHWRSSPRSPTKWRTTTPPGRTRRTATHRRTK